MKAPEHITDAEFVVVKGPDEPVYEEPVVKAWNDPSPLTWDEWKTFTWQAKLATPFVLAAAVGAVFAVWYLTSWLVYGSPPL